MSGNPGNVLAHPDTVDDMVAAIREQLGGTTGVRLGTLVAEKTVLTDIYPHPHGGTHIFGEAFGVQVGVISDEPRNYGFYEPRQPGDRWRVEGYSLADMVSGRFLELQELPDGPPPAELPLELVPGLSYKPGLDIGTLFYDTWESIRRNVAAARQLGLLVVYQSEAENVLSLIRNGRPVTDD